ncbi:uncharacterized protein PFL1_05590 [Pseudozyma flocculosa PF-1]|uniref:Related to versicolorin b synthase n=2 Tax=Pseudozyma flocculosa TaxID=84751 RepID=A0A5C3F9N7_9BASI|nr:uncharacterized protein PFL1_05590 [Pseudozyma flocculosa PF-1]EPQ26955.1 hypothetical protein PFL1_05590 [Pseudozyma flocculosa PF-1]SPO41134.1 related to versicolorin b synthase [Pseudozyma flocculosa]
MKVAASTVRPRAGLLVLFLCLCLTLWLVEARPSKRAPSKEYDYVVVGAGTSGLTLAARLSEDPSVTVAVLEAGIDYKSNLLNQQLTTIPGADVIGAGASTADIPQALIDWGFVTEPQAGAANRRVHFARGKCLGGSSARNFMIYQRPTRQSHQEWVDLTGDDSWSFDARYDDYRRTMAATGPRHELRRDTPAAAYEADAFSPAGGPVQVSFPNYAQPFSASLSRSLNELGVETVRGHNGGSINGVQYATCTIEARGGQRSTSRAFYDQIKGRPNIRIFTQARASRIIFDTGGARPRASQVVFEDRSGLFGVLAGRDATVTARREVVLSAGAFQSPHLLMLSGIGPKGEPAKFGIPLVVDSPHVGQNMADHIFFGPSYPVKVETLTRLASDPVYLAAQYLNFTHQLGPMTNNVADMIAFERWSDSTLRSIGADALASYPPDWPTVEYLSAPGYVGNFDNLFVENAPRGLLGTRNFATILVALVSPQSRGTVTLRSGKASDLPRIDPRWLTDVTDQKVAIAAFKRVRALFASSAMAPILAGHETEPGLDGVRTDDQILAWIRKNLMTVWHPASTARMGRSIDRAVVDAQFRVFGVDGLRVVDASAFPSLLPGHPQSVCYMIAERAAALILADK